MAKLYAEDEAAKSLISGSWKIEAGQSCWEVVPRSSGCSISHQVPTWLHARQPSMVSRTSAFPCSHCARAFRSSQGKPHGHSLLRTGRGPRRLENRARLQVLHGGVKKATWNLFLRISAKISAHSPPLRTSWAGDLSVSISRRSSGPFHNFSRYSRTSDFLCLPAKTYKIESTPERGPGSGKAGVSGEGDGCANSSGGLATPSLGSVWVASRLGEGLKPGTSLGGLVPTGADAAPGAVQAEGRLAQRKEG